MFQEELEFFKENQAKLVEQYEGKILVIKGHEVLGAYDDTIEALNETTKSHEFGTFMIQPCEPGLEAYTVILN